MLVAFLLGFVAAVWLCSSAQAALIVSNVGITNAVGNLFQGDVSKNVLSFKVATNAADQFAGIAVGNSSTSVPFSTSGITNVMIIHDANGNYLFDGGDTVLASQTTFSTTSLLITFAGQNVTTTQNYLILYSVAKNSNTGSSTGVNINFVQDTLANQYTVSSGSNSILVNASGLQVNSTFTANKVPTGLVASQGLTDIPMARLSFNAVNQNITVNAISIFNTNQTFVSTLPQEGISRIKIYYDKTGNDQFDGVANDPLIASYLLSNTNSIQLVDIPVTPSGIISGTHRSFFVFYDVGTSFPVNSQASLAIGGASGVGSSFGNLSLSNVSSSAPYSVTGSVISVVVPALQLVSVQDIAPTNHAGFLNRGVMQGQVDIPMVKMTLSNLSSSSITNATFKFRNPDGTFNNQSQGVNRILLYLKKTSIPTADLLVGSTTSFTSNSDAEITGVNIPAGTNQVFFATYDVGQQATVGSQLSAQFNGITASGASFSGVVPQPTVPNQLRVSAHSLEVIAVSSNVVNIDPSLTSIPVEFYVRNLGALPVLASAWVNLGPTFYLNNINGISVGQEFSVVGGIVPLTVPPFPGTQRITFNATISASGLKTQGLILVDAFLDYRDPNAASNARVKWSRTLVAGNVFTPAAVQTNGNVLWNASGTGVVSYIGKLPDYVASINVQFPLQSVKPFFNADLIANNSKLLIYFVNNGQGLNLASIQLKKNGVSLIPNIDYLNTGNGVITILDMGTVGGTLALTVNDQSGTAQTPANIQFQIASGLVVNNVLVGPSPYDTKTGGNIMFDYQCSQSGAQVTAYLYDSKGNQVWSGTQTAVQGYNQILMSGGNLTSGGQIPTGMYLVRIVAVSGSQKAVGKSKFAVK